MEADAVFSQIKNRHLADDEMAIMLKDNMGQPLSKFQEIQLIHKYWEKLDPNIIARIKKETAAQTTSAGTGSESLFKSFSPTNSNWRMPGTTPVTDPNNRLKLTPPGK
jgi:hypothetical protein